ncbi:MAG: DUF4040 domain-containing protein [Filomicrobium sp.]|nr:DUF4040 domain-containing protein [Filomicrobium sp.]
MTMASVFDVTLVCLILAVGAWSTFARLTFSAIVIFIVYGLLLSLAWVRLAAVDVALTEAAIGSGVTGMLLLNAVARLRSTDAAPTPSRSSVNIAAGVFCTLITASLAGLVLVPPQVPVSLAPSVMESLGQSGLGNPVAGVLFVYRSLDTLLEKVVLVLALIAVWSLAPDGLWGGKPALRPFPQRDSVLIFLARTVPPIGIMVGIYMFWVGADEPGGAFQGGAVLAAMWILVMIAGLAAVPPTSSHALRLALIVGPVVFLAIGILGIFLTGTFLAYPEGYAKPLIIAIEATLTFSIGVTLAMHVVGPPEREWRS